MVMFYSSVFKAYYRCTLNPTYSEYTEKPAHRIRASISADRITKSYRTYNRTANRRQFCFHFARAYSACKHRNQQHHMFIYGSFTTRASLHLSVTTSARLVRQTERDDSYRDIYCFSDAQRSLSGNKWQECLEIHVGNELMRHTRPEPLFCMRTEKPWSACASAQADQGLFVRRYISEYPMNL